MQGCELDGADGVLFLVFEFFSDLVGFDFEWYAVVVSESLLKDEVFGGIVEGDDFCIFEVGDVVAMIPVLMGE